MRVNFMSRDITKGHVKTWYENAILIHSEITTRKLHCKRKVNECFCIEYIRRYYITFEISDYHVGIVLFLCSFLSP